MNATKTKRNHRVRGHESAAPPATRQAQAHPARVPCRPHAPPPRTAPGLLIPRLARNVPTSYGDGTERNVVNELLEAGLLKPGDKAISIDDHIVMAMRRIPHLASFEDMGRCYISERDGYGFTLYAPGNGIDNRIHLAPIFAEVWGRGDLQLIAWMAAVLNEHPLIAGPERMTGVVEANGGNINSEEFIAEVSQWRDKVAKGFSFNEDAAIAFVAPEWLQSTLVPKGKDSKLIEVLAERKPLDRLADLERISPKLGSIFRELIDTGAKYAVQKWSGGRNWACCDWYHGCPVSHCWDYECYQDSEGNLGEDTETFNFSVKTLAAVVSAFALIDEVTKPITKLQQWKSKLKAPASPSDMLSLSTKATGMQLSLTMK